MTRILIRIFTAATLLIVMCGCSPNFKITADTLVSVKTTQAPTVDAVAEDLWASAPVMTVVLDKRPYEPDTGYKGMRSTKVTLKSLYDADNIYFLVQWDDPTKSLERWPWVKQADGSWKQLMAKDSTGRDNTYYEDQMSLIWDINNKGFAEKGCAMSCHVAEDGKVDGVEDKSPGRKFTQPGETLDVWHWKGLRTGSVGQIDDQYINSDRAESKNWGRHGDVKTAGGSEDNINEAKDGPAFMNARTTEDNRYFIAPENKVAFKDEFKAGDVVPGILVSPFEGSRADIKAQAKWENGVWTVEFSRKLVTTGEQSETQDVQFKDLSKLYNFGLAVFDNTQINHLFHTQVLHLQFKR